MNITTPLDDFVLAQGRLGDAGNAVAGSILQLCDDGYLTLFREQSGGVILQRTSKRIDLQQSPWVGDILDALFGGPNVLNKQRQLGDIPNGTLPVAQDLMRTAQKRLLRAGLIRKVRPAWVVRGIKLPVTLAVLACTLVSAHHGELVNMLGFAVAGILIWVIGFLAYLDPIGQRRLFLTKEGEARMEVVRKTYGLGSDKVPRLPINVAPAQLKWCTRPSWWSGVWEMGAPEAAIATMAAALNQKPVAWYYGWRVSSGYYRTDVHEATQQPALASAN